jgi:hypothetical protein
MASATTLSAALQSLGERLDRAPRHAVQHGAAGTLLAIALPGQPSPGWRGVWVRPDGVDFLGEAAPPSGLARAFHLSGDSAKLVDLLADAVRRYVEEVEAVDERLAALQKRGHSVPPEEVWALQREVAGLRAMIGRALVVAAEAAGPLAPHFPGAEPALEAANREVGRARDLAVSVQQGLSDLILLRNAVQGNRIAETANELSRTSNRIAALANISNIRMLGLTYIAFTFGLVSVVVLIPNTGATILGMPSAAWVPGYWVDALLVALGVAPFVLLFSRHWVRRVLLDLGPSERRAEEGLADLPEVPAEPSPGLGRKEM